MASTADLEAEILAELEENPDAYVTPVNDVITIDPETRTIHLPASEALFGTEEEQDVERKYFKCPRIVGDNIDLAAHQIYISYMAVKDKNATLIPELLPETYWCEDVNVDDTGNYITFSWLLSGNVLRNRGFVGFAVIAKSMEGEMLKTRWKTAPAVGTVLITIPDGGEAVAEMYPDIISQLLNRMDAVEAIATPEEIQNYVEAYLAENPPSGMTAEEKEQLDKNSEDISQLSEEIENLDVRSIADIQKTASELLVDTYTITYTDGTSSTFKVTNGSSDEAYIESVIRAWLDEHPEATTTVQNGAITYEKLSDDVKDVIDRASKSRSASQSDLVKVINYGNILKDKEDTYCCWPFGMCQYDKKQIKWYLCIMLHQVMVQVLVMCI